MATELSRSKRVREAIEAAWDTMAEDYGLFPELSGDAALARADRGELVAATPRLLELLVSGQLEPGEAVTVVERLGAEPWPADQRLVIEEVLDAWWLETLRREPGEHHPPYTPDTVLGVLVSYNESMVRWFEAWLPELDGPGVIHLADMVLAGVPTLLQNPAWAGKADQAGRVTAWARSETVVNGLVMIGGTHLEPDVFSDLLDHLI